MTSKLFSAPPALVRQFGCIPGYGWYATNDPVGKKLGSGGGTAHLVAEAWRETGGGKSFLEWMRAEKRILIHAGGQSRRLPAYAASGKAIAPLPVFRWGRGQRVCQTLVEEQMPLFEKLLESAPENLRWLVASGDVLIRAGGPLPVIPDVDVLCAGIWTEPETALKHGVFFSPRGEPEKLAFMFQKPSLEKLRETASRMLFQLDVGLWLMSDAAMLALMKKCGWNAERGSFEDGEAGAYDMYGQFGLALGSDPTLPDPEISKLSSSLLPLSDGGFYHFGTSRDLICSSLALQNLVRDRRGVQMRFIKPHPDLFVQNSITERSLSEENGEIWVENSYIPKSWKLGRANIVTGVPQNDWKLELPDGACLDVVPVGEKGLCLRFYGIDDAFRGSIGDESTLLMGKSAAEWFATRGISLEEAGISPDCDIQKAKIFPHLESRPEGDFVQWLFDSAKSENPEKEKARYLTAGKLSADELGDIANLKRLFAQRETFLEDSVKAIAEHAGRSVFYQIDLSDLAEIYAKTDKPLPAYTPEKNGEALHYAQDRMFRSRVAALRGADGQAYCREAFEALCGCLVESAKNHVAEPRFCCKSDQIVWGRSPVRFDVAGGWTDTPPYCLFTGGRVLNIAIELNGQPPLQVFARTTPEPQIVLRSIDLGVTSLIRSYDEIADYAKIGSGFAIPKAALALAGFLPAFSRAREKDLESQLRRMGGGIELTLLSAVPKGSGLGTSSILSATILGVLSDLCGLGWDEMEVCNLSLIVEQMLTSGGGWQDQFGGVLRGIKYLRTRPGLDQTPEVRYLPEHIFEDPENSESLLLYYTGITRVAKKILAEIVRGMFLNRRETMLTLEEIGDEADELFTAMQRSNFGDLGKILRRTWESKKRLDEGSCTPEISTILDPIDDLLTGASIGGAAGGGFILMAAKDPTAAARVRKMLLDNPPNDRARFVDLSLSKTGMQITRS
jgi:galactokinase/mevalonate kinase-like predicted kinase